MRRLDVCFGRTTKEVWEVVVKIRTLPELVQDEEVITREERTKIRDDSERA